MPIISGRCDESRQRLTIPVKVSDGAGPYQELEFELDTGSDDALGLSRQDIAALGLAPADEPADGLPQYAASVEWLDGPTTIAVVETERPRYVGMGLLWEYYMSAHMFENGKVTVERMFRTEHLIPRPNRDPSEPAGG